MSHIVTATITPKTNLRREQVPSEKVETICSGFSDKTGETYNFFGDGGEIIDLEIRNKLNFDLRIPNQQKNWLTLKMFKFLNPTDAKHIIMIDQEEENSKALDFSDKVFEVQKFLRENKEDDSLLAKIYRRVIGLVDGVSQNAIFRRLLEIASEKPEKFFNRSEIIVENEEFEMLALIDICIERGILLRDNKMIKLSSGKIYAEDESKAAFFLIKDTETRLYLQRAVAGVREENSPYEPIIEDSEYVNLKNQLLGDVPKKENKNEEIIPTDEEIGTSITRFVKANLVVKEGVAANTVYVLPDHPTTKFKREDLVAFFKKNPVPYRMFCKQAFA